MLKYFLYICIIYCMIWRNDWIIFRWNRKSINGWDNMFNGFSLLLFYQTVSSPCFHPSVSFLLFISTHWQKFQPPACTNDLLATHTHTHAQTHTHTHRHTHVTRCEAEWRAFFTSQSNGSFIWFPWKQLKHVAKSFVVTLFGKKESLFASFCPNRRILIWWKRNFQKLSKT